MGWGREQNNAQRADGADSHACGTSGISPAERARMPEASRDSSLGTFGDMGAPLGVFRLISMKIITATLLLTLSLACALVAGQRGQNHPETRPSLTLRAAIDLAEVYAKEHKIDLSNHYLYSVRLIPGREARGGQACKVIWEQSQRVDDDEVEFIVDMDKKVTPQPRG